MYYFVTLRDSDATYKTV